jgi:hypothetical protein
MSAGTVFPLLLSDLIAFTPSSNPNDRYYLTDTGKEGEFYLQATYPVSGPTPPAADNAITVNSNPISGNVYRYRRINPSGLIDVRWFGALGDGTDQSAALQAAFATIEGNTIVFDAPGGGSFVINSVTLTLAAGKVLKFLPGNILGGTATINGGIIDAGYLQQIFSTAFNISPAGCMSNMVSVVWFGAGTVSDSQPAIQKAVSVVIGSTALPKTVYFPRGSYIINAPVIIAKYNSTLAQYEQATVLLKGEEPGVNRFSELAATIIVNFKDRFGFGFQLCKSGGIESLTIIGLYTVPSMATDAFFNNNPFSSYGDPTCRDSRYSPYCAVAIDPFLYNALPPDGGYPGNDGNGVALSTYYTKATGQPDTRSGSSGLYFKDLFVSNFTVCFAETPNGETQDGEAMIYEDIQVANCKLGFSSAQAQEKSNSYEKIICWGITHTLFSNGDYGISNSAGNVIVQTVNIAGAVNRVLNWGVGGWFPSYFKNIYAESLGSFGNLLSSGIACAVEDSIFDFEIIATEGFGNYYPANHVYVTKEITFRSCVFRLYDNNGLPVLLAGSGVYEECTFETAPITRIEEGLSSADTIQFYNCLLSLFGGKLGSREYVRGSINQFGGYSLYGDYSLTDSTSQIYGVFGQYAIQFYQPRIFLNYAISATITISGTNRSFTFTTIYYSLFVVNEPIGVIQGANYEFCGIVTAIDSATGTVTVSYAPASLANGAYYMCLYAFLKPFRILGDLTEGSNSITNVVDGGFPGNVGDLVFLPELGGYCRITATSGSTYTVTNNSFITKTGVTLTPPAITYKMNSFNPYAPASTQVGANTVFKKGDTLIDTYNGIYREYICIADGMFNPSDGRIAYFTLNGSLQNSLTATGSISIPAGFVVEGFILNANAAQSGITIGTTSGGTDISSGLSLTAGVSKIQEWDYFTDSATTIYFGGISGATVSIKTMIKAV